MKWVEAQNQTPIAGFAAGPISAEILVLLAIAVFIAVLATRLLRRQTFAERLGSLTASKTRERPLGPVTQSVVAPKFPPQNQSNMADPTQQMLAIAKVGFRKKRLLNSEEARLLPILEDLVRSSRTRCRVMAQTSLGELIKPAQGERQDDSRNAYAAINSKRLDFAIIDSKGYLICAIEYQGSGHYQGNAFMRDAVKKEALRRAGVPLLEVPETFSKSDVEQAIRKYLEPVRPGSNHRKPAIDM